MSSSAPAALALEVQIFLSYAAGKFSSVFYWLKHPRNWRLTANSLPFSTLHHPVYVSGGLAFLTQPKLSPPAC